MKLKGFLSIAIVIVMVLALAGCGGNSSAADYPKQTIKVYVPYAPGGGSDTLARAMIQAIDIPVDMVAVNMEGANGLVGTMEAFNANADGYSILVQSAQDLMGFSMSGATDISLYEEMETICYLVGDFNFVVTNKESGWKTIEDMVEYAKAHPGDVKWSCSGGQGIDFAETNLVLEGLGIKDVVTVVPYDSGSSGNVALLGNHVQMSTNTTTEIAGSIEAGDVIPLLAIAKERLEWAPDVPTTLEKGVDYSSYSPRGFYAPPGTPAEIVKYLQDAMEKVLANDEFVERMTSFGLITNFVPGEQAFKDMKAQESFLKPFFENMEDE
ncbi:MAG: tripartite tricarboxylate transporter substrate binding protein [Clostridiales Family XIII bacterium]|nr:tripartite tricarboxylate transporter substrate binding protein [Clostridiales Family XIII bacterium]